MILPGDTPWSRDPATNQVNLVEGQKVDFTINNLYNYNAFDNQIICQATFVDLAGTNEDKIFTQSTTFNFTKVGNNGTNGTDMIAKIEPKINHSLYIQQPPTIIKYDKQVFFNTLYKPVNSLDLTSVDDGFFQVKLFQKTEEVDLSKANIR